MKRSANPALTVAFLYFVSLALVACYFIFRNNPQFDLDAEYNIPTYYESALFLLAACAAFKNRGRRSSPNFGYWVFIGCALLYAAIDEVAGIHEAITGLTSQMLHGAQLHNIWMLIYIPVMYFGVRALKGLWFDLKRTKPVCAWLMVAALLAWSLTFPAELLVQWQVISDRYWHWEIAIEEFLEMNGSILLYAAFTLAR